MDKVMNMDRINEIVEYENKNAVEDSLRITEYVPEYDSYKLKVGIGMKEIQAVLDKIGQNVYTEKYYVEKKMDYGATDVAMYAIENEEQMLHSFAVMDALEKKAGFITEKGEKVPLIKMTGLKSYTPVPYNKSDQEINRKRNVLMFSWIQTLMTYKFADEKEELKQLLQDVAVKNKKFNFRQHIQQNCSVCKKVFHDKKMVQYDFRGIDCEGAIFINCDLTECNFSFVNLENAVFVNCKLEDAVFAGAMLNNVYHYTNCNREKIVDVHKDIF